jgi:hypothetical protein
MTAVMLNGTLLAGMKQKTKIFEVDGTRYQIARFKLELASYLLGRIVRAVKIEGPRGEAATEQPGAKQEKPEPEAIARVMIAAGLFGDIDRATRAEIQNECMRACARLEGDDLPMPLSNGSELLIDDLGLVLRLEMETLVFNLTPFFASGGLTALGAQSVPNSPKA